MVKIVVADPIGDPEVRFSDDGKGKVVIKQEFSGDVCVEIVLDGKQLTTFAEQVTSQMNSLLI